MRDIMLQVDTYAEPTPPHTIRQAVAFAGALEAELTGFATHIDINVPDNWIAERLLHVNAMASAEESKSLAAARQSLEYLDACARAAGVKAHSLVARANLHGIGPCVARHARARDLCLVSVGDRMDSQRAVAEDVIFGSGRPVLVFHPDRAPLPATLTRVAVTWDGSRSAARAAADAMPVLKRASDVRVVTAVGEKPSATAGVADDLIRHLLAHGVSAHVDEVDGRHRSIGASLDEYISKAEPHLVVMGAYGSSRLKEFVLGGATEHVLNRVRTPTLFSH